MEVHVNDNNTANPAPLGLLGFGMTTILLNLCNAGVYPFNAMILGMGLFVGGLAQVIAGIMEWKKGNTFGTTAFTAYGVFWMSLVVALVFPKSNLGDAPNSIAMACYLIVWGLFTTVMFIGTLKLNRMLRVVFSTLAVLFFLLAAADFTGIKLIKTIAGIEGIFCGLSAVYGSVAQVINEVYGRNVLPI